MLLTTSAPWAVITATKMPPSRYPSTSVVCEVMCATASASGYWFAGTESGKSAARAAANGGDGNPAMKVSNNSTPMGIGMSRARKADCPDQVTDDHHLPPRQPITECGEPLAEADPRQDADRDDQAGHRGRVGPVQDEHCQGDASRPIPDL